MGQLCTMGLGSIQFWEATAMLEGNMDCKETQADPHSPLGLQGSLDTSRQGSSPLCGTGMNRRPVFKPGPVTNRVTSDKAQE